MDQLVRRLSAGREEPDWLARDREAAWSAWLASAEAGVGTQSGSGAVTAVSPNRSVPAPVAVKEVLPEPRGARLESPTILASDAGGEPSGGVLRAAGIEFDLPAAPAGVVILPLAEAVSRYPELVRESLAAVADTAAISRPTQRDRLDAARAVTLARALWTDGVFVRVPDEVTLPKPVVLRFGADGGTAPTSAVAPTSAAARASTAVPTSTAVPPSTAVPRVLRVVVAMGRHSRATVVETWGAGDAARGDGTPPVPAGAPIVAATELILADGAEVRFARVQALPADAKAALAVTGVLGRDARLRCIEAEAGGNATFSAATLSLSGEGARVDGAVLFIGAGENRRDIRAVIEHKASHTQSDIVVRGALAGRAKASFAGHTDIVAGAKATSGWQSAKTLLLSPDARIDALPALEIDDWDVDAGHAASAGAVDETALYYLMSRGIPHEAATAMLAEAFIEPVARLLPGDQLQETVMALVREKIAGAPVPTDRGKKEVAR